MQRHGSYFPPQLQNVFTPSSNAPVHLHGVMIVLQNNWHDGDVVEMSVHISQ